MKSFDTYTDEDFKRTIWSALRLVAIAVALDRKSTRLNSSH